MKKLRMVLSTLLVLVSLFTGCAGALADFTATVYTSEMKVYSRNDTASRYLLGKLKKNTAFTVTATSGNWAKITYKGRTGFALISDMKSSKKTTMYTNRDVVAYQKPSSSSKSLGKLGKNTKVYMVGMSGSYYLVENSKGQTGYIAKEALSKTITTTAAYTKKPVYVYKSASTSSVLTTVSVNTKVSVIGSSGSFSKVKNASGTVGYIQTANLSASKVSVSKKTAYANKACPVYKAASTSSAKWCTVAVNTKMYVIGEIGSFYAVTTTSGSKTGYIAKSNLSASKTSTGTTDDGRKEYTSDTSTTVMPSSLKSTTSKYVSGMSAKERIEVAIYYAQSQLGYGYSSSPNNRTTFDCLTLCYYAYRAAGASIPSSAYACGYSGSFEYIKSISDLKRGDIVCFDTVEDDNDKSDHTGIYLGSGRFIHASSGAKLVVVSSLSSGYYNRTFYVGRRILK